MNKLAARTIWKGLLGANVALILWFWWSGSHSLFSLGTAGVSIALGKLLGLTAAGFVLMQFVLMGRFPLIERTFGLDRLARVHRTTGKLSIIFILLHPILLVIGYSQLSGVSLLTQFLVFMQDYDDVFEAVIGLLLFCIVVGTSLTIIRRKLKYEFWYIVHLIVYLAVFFSYSHQFKVGEDIIGNRLFYGYWMALYIIVLGSFLIFRFGRPLYLFWYHQFSVSRIVRENYNIVSVYITGHNISQLQSTPGQFMIVRFLTKGKWWQAHPFSLSFIPSNNEWRITVKDVGDFTSTMSTIPVGTKVIIDGPYGLFTDAVRSSKKVLFIAGGIGITPIRSLFEQMVKRGNNVILLYANKTKKDIVLHEELSRIAQQSTAPIIHVLSDEPGYTGEKGFVDEEKIKRLVPDVKERDVYVCGPPSMMDAMIALLQKIGVPQERIHYERFAL